MWNFLEAGPSHSKKNKIENSVQKTKTLNNKESKTKEHFTCLECLENCCKQKKKERC